MLKYHLLSANPEREHSLPSGSSKASLRHLLGQWVGNIAPDREHFLMHKLSMLYPKQKLAIDSLQKADFTQVHILNDVCKHDGFAVYLANVSGPLTGIRTFFGQAQCTKFRHVSWLNGQVTGILPEARRAMYERVDSDSDSEDFQLGYGKTMFDELDGSRGDSAMPTFSVVLIVPPQYNMEFILSSHHKYADALQMLDDLCEEHVLTGKMSSETYKLCDHLLPKKLVYRERQLGGEDVSSYMGCIDTVINLCLKNSWIPLYDRVPLSQKLRTSNLLTFVRVFVKKDTSEMKSCLRPALSELSNLSERCKVVHDIVSEANEIHMSNEQRQSLSDWHRSAMIDCLNAVNGHDRRCDSNDLVRVVQLCSFDLSDHLARILGDKRIISIESLLTFVTRIHEKMSDQQSVQARYLALGLDHAWARIDLIAGFGQVQKRHWNRFFAITKEHNTDKLVAAFQKMAEEVQNRKLTMVSHAFRTKSGSGGRLAYHNTSLPSHPALFFVTSLLRGEYPCLTTEPTPAVLASISAFIRAAISKYIVDFVGDEPREPGDWKRDAKGCKGCEDCTRLDDFMLDPDKQSCSTTVFVLKEKHLLRFYTEKGDEDYVVEKVPIDRTLTSERMGGTQKVNARWTYTKNQNSFERELDMWQNKRRSARSTIYDMDASNGSILRPYLGDRKQFDSIMSCTPEGLPAPNYHAKATSTPEVAGASDEKRLLKRACNFEDGDCRSETRSAKRYALLG